MELSLRPDMPVSRRGDIVISVDGPTVRAAFVLIDGAVVQAPLQCLRLRGASTARSRTIAALLSAGLPSVPRDLVVRWPTEVECERIARSLDVVIDLRQTAAGVAHLADRLLANTLGALAAGAVPGDDHGVDRVPGGEASRRVGGGRQVRGQSER